MSRRSALAEDALAPVRVHRHQLEVVGTLREARGRHLPRVAHLRAAANLAALRTEHDAAREVSGVPNAHQGAGEPGVEEVDPRRRPDDGPSGQARLLHVLLHPEQSFTLIALALLHKLTRDAVNRQEILEILAFLRTHLYKDGRVLHHWMDGRLAVPTDPEYYCSRGNLQLLYILQQLDDLLAPPTS